MVSVKYALSQAEETRFTKDGYPIDHEYIIVCKGKWYEAYHRDIKVFYGDNPTILLQTVIDRISSIGGGRILVTPGDYQNANVTVKSKVYFVLINVSNLNYTRQSGAIVIRHESDKVIQDGISFALQNAYLIPANITSLPTASADYRGYIAVQQGASGVADKIVACLKDTTDAYSWVTVAVG